MTHLFGTRVPTLGTPLAAAAMLRAADREPGEGEGDGSTLPVD